jgi:ribosomal protein S18 acetylase RimI-like enzyme
MNDKQIEAQPKQEIFLSPARKLNYKVEGEKSDLEQVIKLITDVNDHLTETLGLDHYTWYTDDAGERIIEKVLLGNTFVVEDNRGRVVATFTIGREKIEYGLAEFFDENGTVIAGKSQFDDSPAYYLSMMCVSPDLQGNGIGTRVMQMMERIIEVDVKTRGQSSYLIRFDAREQYTKLMEFYKKQGYNIVGSVDETNYEIENPKRETYLLFERETYPDTPRGAYGNYKTPAKEA